MRKGIRELFNDFDSEDRRTIEREVDTGARLLGADVEWGEPPSRYDKDLYGICFDCKNLRTFRTKYGKIYAKCYEFEERLNSKDPVEDCSCYSRRGEMDLFSMKEIAIIIDNTKRQQAGFIVKE